MGIFSKKEEVIREFPVKPEAETTVPAPDVTATEIVNTYTDEMGIIAAGTIIHGNVRTKGHLAVAGIVEGKVSTAGNLMLTGEIRGAIKCNNIVIDGGHCHTNIITKGSVSIKGDTTVASNITCKHISISGTVYGDIKATGNVGLTKTAIVKGDIQAAVLAVEPGAKICGNVIVK